MVDDEKQVGEEEPSPTLFTSEGIVTNINFHAPDGPIRGLRRSVLQTVCKLNKINHDGSAGKEELVRLIEERQAEGKTIKGIKTED